MDSRGLLFIPDISGFTKFVNETDIEHSRLIIQELLELLINSNEMGLEVSEVEGDAILFYKFGDPPALESVFQQVEKMFCEFHQHLNVYDRLKFCQCKACLAAINLTLKVITHYGEFSTYSIKNFQKLIGKDVIVAHQLLKNDIPQHEYWLVTNNLTNDPTTPNLASWMEWKASSKNSEGNLIPFHYTQLSSLKSKVHPASDPALDLSAKKKLFSINREYKTDLITLFHAAGDFQYRSQWQEGVKSVEEISHILPRVGTKCRLILNNGESIVYSNSYSYRPDRVEFSETYEGSDFVRHFILQKIDDNLTSLTLDYYINKNVFSFLKYALSNKNKTKAEMMRSLEKLEEVIVLIR
jgi:hypothetical protein